VPSSFKPSTCFASWEAAEQSCSRFLFFFGDEILNESYRLVLCYNAVYCAVREGAYVYRIRCLNLRWKLLTSAFLFHSIFVIGFGLWHFSDEFWSRKVATVVLGWEIFLTTGTNNTAK